MAIKDMDELLDEPKKETKINSFVKNADMSKASDKRNKGGRPKKNESDKANKQIFVNLTEEQKGKLESYASSMGTPVSTIVKMLLAKEGII